MTVDAEPNLDRAFRVARRRDWSVVWQSHLLALPLSSLVFAGLCTNSNDIPFPLVAHYFSWLVLAVVFSLWPLSFICVAGMLLGPIIFYRAVCYYRYGGTSALLQAGVQGTWMELPGSQRLFVAFAMAASPTRRLLRLGLSRHSFASVGPPLPSPSRLRMRAFLALTISLNHLPFNYAIQTSFCINFPWTLTVPNWLGGCEASFGYKPGVRPFGCRR